MTLKLNILCTIVITAVATLTVVPLAARADYYKYTDKTGAVCITNTPDSVPPKYRSSMKVIREETLDRKDRANRIESQRQAPAAPESAPPEEAQKQDTPAEPVSVVGRLKARSPWLLPALLAGAVIVLFLIVRKLSEIMPSPLLARLIALSFFVGVFLFTYKLYAEHISTSYFTIKTKTIALFEKANRSELPEPGEKPPAVSVPAATEQSPR